MVFKKYVQIGRVAVVNYGPDLGKLCTIIDIIDETRVLVDGPLTITGVVRQAMPLKWIVLTKFVVTIPHSCNSHLLVKAFKKAEVVKKFNQTRWASKLHMRASKLQMNDFDRFKVMIAQKSLHYQIYMKTNTLRRKDQIAHTVARKKTLLKARANQKKQRIASKKIRDEKKANMTEEQKQAKAQKKLHRQTDTKLQLVAKLRKEEAAKRKQAEHARHNAKLLKKKKAAATKKAPKPAAEKKIPLK
eukprot:TRINITY_DN3106_c0_g2_i1.p1 TRINITY_DN3106_c0_g2~~TRINITY_DN3106_c0_g2_i1.p1  ORF type:complete len:245 (-),score=86.89 TRINITY_DN3106_c0_g2_i1:98-832(-)